MDDGDDGERERETDRRSLLTDVLDTSDVGTFILDGNFEVVWVNEAVEEYFGLDRDAVLGADKRELVIEQIQDRFIDSDQFAERVLATYDDNTYVENFECHVRDTETTDERWLEHWSQPIETGPYAGGRIEHYTDITDQKYREQELDRRRHELENQTERLQNFASVLSHDLRTPLYTVQTYVGVLRENGNAEQAVIDEIEQAVDRADAIIDDVLALAREGTSVIDLTSVDIAAVATDAWESVETGDAALDVEDECIVTADAGQLSRLFENLFRNSVEHGGDGVRIRVGRLGDAGFYVADDGAGIPADRRDSVLEWGYSSTGDGTGFGLAIVRQIAEAHGWETAVTESEDGGARVEFRNVDVVSADAAE
ncbi:PAS domain-containing sensor histidine kinase [Halorussus gelatinilyticus]|uniref:histidine kinase n=1 Tax=Halorussus gelatinilyticus TaxID=2937524 RepID=A0A8U0IIE2_9EURY|nr:ATP-binding protein [Halorussus gelatinilyticus]UPW00867.1 PAS domain-containing sensor histidine kinase [Halorussus gelatinilyticus]